MRKLRLWLLIVPLAFVFVGAASNQLVLIANHDTFPVLVNGHKAGEYGQGSDQFLDDTHVVMDDNSRLKPLADIIDLGNEIDSIGDLFIDLGLFLLWPYATIIWATLLVSDHRRRLCP